MKHKISSVVFEVTSKCNLRCRYCYNVHKADGGPVASNEGYRRAKKTLTRLFQVADVPRITMSGGEPFLAERFLELVLFCRMKKKRVVSITNGNGGGEEDYRLLVQAGVELFEIPVLADRPEEHDWLTRVEGSWRKAQDSIDSVAGLGVQVVPVIVLTKTNLPRLGETLKLLHRKGLQRVMVNRFNVGGFGIEHSSALELSVEDLNGAFALCNDLSERLGLVITSNVCSPVCLVEPKKYPRVGFACCSTDVAKRPLTLDPEGNFRFCNHSPVNMGNIFEKSMGEILEGDYAKSWAEIVPVICRDCLDWDRCMGGCRAACEQLGWGLGKADPLLGSQEK